MSSWALIPEDSGHLYSPVGLRLLDELTGSPPLGTVSALLDVLSSSGAWQTTDIAEVRTPSGVVTYPGLERHVDLTGQSPRQYRVRLAADLYIPDYQANADGIVFTAYPYNDQSPPGTIVKTPSDTLLVPAANYPFATHLSVLRGMVLDAGGEPVGNAVVTQGNNERALSSANGAFALPLRWVAANANLTIDATDQRTGRTGSVQIQLPDALYTNQAITIS